MDLTITGYDAHKGVYTARDGNGKEYYLDVDVVTEAEQLAKEEGNLEPPAWTTDMDGVVPVEDWP